MASILPWLRDIESPVNVTQPARQLEGVMTAERA